jgi:hypothetical protein
VTDETTPTHRRTITVESFETDDGFEMRGTLVDERPWAESQTTVRTLHSMALTLRVNRASMLITDARAEMAACPHEECRTIEPAFRGLVGVSITRGYNRAVQDKLGRQLGCSHLDFLARAMGPAAIQTMASSSHRRGEPFVSSGSSDSPSQWLTNTCHLWAEGGIGAEKMRLGWRPGVEAYPTPTLVELRRRAKTTRTDAP